jgi:hypothetical protein
MWACGHPSRTHLGGLLQSTIVLCRCDCHEACTLPGWEHVPLTAWQELCDCPGAAFQRTWKEDIDDPWPGTRETRAQQRRAEQERKEAHDQAFQAASEAARGKTRREVRELYLAELRRRGGPDPMYECFLEAEVDALMRRPWRAFARLAQVMRNHISPEEEQLAAARCRTAWLSGHVRRWIAASRLDGE